MRIALVYLLANIPAVFLICISSYLAVHGIHGWGWFLFVAFCLHVTVENKEK